MHLFMVHATNNDDSTQLHWLQQLNKNPKRDSDTSPGWMGNLGASVAYATNLSFQSTLFAIRYGKNVFTIAGFAGQYDA